VKLADAGLTLGDVDLGGFDAESDYKLAEHFVTTAYVESALAGRRTLLLGRKGSGKSALFRQLPRLVEAQGLPTVVIPLTPDAYSWSALKQYQEQGLLPEHAHMNAWKLTLAIEVAGRLISMEHTWSNDASESIKRLESFVRENFGTLEPNLLTTATGLLKGLHSLNLSAFGFGVGVQRNGTDSQPITPAVIAALLDTLAAPLEEQQVIVEFDRLDDSWDGSAESQSLLIGLIKAAKDINDRFGFGNGSQLRVLTFLRSDIYDGLRFDDKDKHRPSEEHILWSMDGLREMLTKRLPESLSADELFEEGEMRGRITPFNYIVKRTFLRPREVLQFVDQCIRHEGAEAIEVSKAAVRSAEDLYSKWKVEDLKQEFAKVSPDFEALLEALRQEFHRYESIEELEALLRSKAEAIVERLTPRGALELLFEASVIGVRLRGAGSTRFKSDDPELTLPASGAVYVHQSLYKGLNIVEARRPAEESTEEDRVFEDEKQ
jgi:energy-coupling factor transporter ATP-binding protein EcfA2